MQTNAHRLSMPTMIAYGVGQFGESLRTVGYTTFLLFYYNQVLGLSGTLTSFALGVSLIVDALSDPIVGALSDRTHSRWGRRHPFMVAGVLPLGFLFYATFNPPQLTPGGYFAWLMVTATLTRCAISLYQGPHLAFGAEMARDYRQRSTLYSINTAFMIATTYGAQALALRWFFPTTAQFNPGLLNPAAYGRFALVFALLMVAAILVSIVGTLPQIRYLRPTSVRHPFSLPRVGRDFIELFHNDSFRALFFGMAFTMLTLAAESVLKPYMDLHFWGLTTEQMSWRPAAILLGVLLALPAVPMLTRRFDKKATLLVAGAASVLGIHVTILLRLVAPEWFPQNGSSSLLPILLAQDVLTGLSSTLTYGAVHSMLADISDEHELATGERREGTLFACRAFTQQIVQSIGIAAGGALLDFITFPKRASAGSVDAVTLAHLGAIPLGAAVIYLLGLCCFRGYRMHSAKHEGILLELERRQAQRLPGAS
jgi:GPH family glycoside/pentoside/hexuronide:cation symporter